VVLLVIALLALPVQQIVADLLALLARQHGAGLRGVLPGQTFVHREFY
jgi:hypothetical protein